MYDSYKRRLEDEQRYMKAGRLPPGQSLTEKFPVLHNGPVPNFNPATWDLRIWGEVEQEVRLTWSEFNRLPRLKIQMDLHCVTRWSMFETIWEGISVKTLLSELGIRLKTSARFVLQHAEYGFTTNLPLAVVLQDNFLLATHYNGEPISAEHGYPLRGVVGYIPGRDDLKTPYLWKGAKWLRGLEFLAEDQLGYWERGLYHNDADVWKEERFR